jgi:hypothetical protein
MDFMVPEASSQIIKDICQFMGVRGGECAEWRIGLTTSLDEGLFRAHEVPRDYPCYIWRLARSKTEAHAIVQGFKNLSCEVPSSEIELSEDSPVYVFAYFVTPLKRKPAAEPRAV